MKNEGADGCVEIKKHSLSIGREGFLWQGGAIFNKIDENLRNEENVDKFKIGVKKMDKSNVDIKP